MTATRMSGFSGIVEQAERRTGSVGRPDRVPRGRWAWYLLRPRWRSVEQIAGLGVAEGIRLDHAPFAPAAAAQRRKPKCGALDADIDRDQQRQKRPGKTG